MPSISSLCMNSTVAALAKGDQVVLIIGATFCKRKYVMHFLHRNQYPFLKAELTEGMLLHIGIADDFPVLSVPALCRRTITTVLLILCVSFLLVLLAVPAVSQPRAPGIRAGFLRFVWHGCLLSGITKAPKGLLLPRLFCHIYLLIVS